MPTDEELMQTARENAKEKMGFLTHLAVFVAVNLVLIAIWWITSGPGSFPWFLFVTLFWGIGLVSHYLNAFHGHTYTERMAEREFRRLKGER
jgi:hypothetical protein